MEVAVFISALILANLFSLFWTAFALEASLYRFHWYYSTMHKSDLFWFASWYSCQTFAALVSVTNMVAISLLGWNVRNWALGRLSQPRGEQPYDEKIDEKMQDTNEGQLGVRRVSVCSNSDSPGSRTPSSSTARYYYGSRHIEEVESGGSYYKYNQWEDREPLASECCQCWHHRLSSLRKWRWITHRQGQQRFSLSPPTTIKALARLGITFLLTAAVAVASWYIGLFAFRVSVAISVDRTERDVIIPWNG